MFTMGSTIIFLGNNGHHAIQAMITAFICFLPILFLYSKLLKKYPGKTIFEICDEVLPKSISILFKILFMLLALYIGMRVIFNYSDFIITVAYSTSNFKYLIGITLAICAMYLLKCKLKTITRFAQAALIIAILFTGIILLVGSSNLDYSNILPIIPYYMDEYINQSWVFFVQPFIESIMLYNIMTKIKDKPNVYFKGLGLSLGIFILYMVRIYARLGQELTNVVNYPLYTDTSVITYKSYISGMEVLTLALYFLSVLMKLTVCEYNLFIGIKSIKIIKDNWIILVINISLIFLSYFTFKSFTDVFMIQEYYLYYASIIGVLIPFVLVVMKKRKVN